MLKNVLCLALVGVVLTISVPSFAQEVEQTKQRLLDSALIIEPVGVYGRAPFHTDAVQAALAAGTFQTPAEGAAVALPDGSAKSWRSAAAGDDGWLKDPALRGGYAFTTINSPADRIAILHARGHGMVYVNGEPRAGDPYALGFVRLPVALHAGDNTFLFHIARGQVAATLEVPTAPLYLDAADATLPDLIVGEALDAWVGVVLVNASGRVVEPAVVLASVDGGEAVRTGTPRMEPCSIRKIPVRVAAEASASVGAATLRLSLQSVGGAAPGESEIPLRVRTPTQTRRTTFISAIDGSVQYYAVVPASPGKADPGPRALVLSLHGASVEAMSQADAYSAKGWCDIVCPTNRRPFGFDWEDWGRIDAFEVLELARQSLASDPSRIYLTGHSMGGHGTWSLACLFPDRFGAAAPSAGWPSFQAYTGAATFPDDSPVGAILRRAASPSDTLRLTGNLRDLGVYILHGDADDNVPVSLAREMRDRLAGFHNDLHYHEQAGAGHWWESSDEPGAECIDWPPIFDLFAHRRVAAPGEVRDVEFTTVNPAVSARRHWLTVEQQIHALEPSTATLRCDPLKRRFTGTTSNVACLSLDLAHLRPGGPVSVQLDGVTIAGAEWPADARLTLVREGDAWALAESPPPHHKGPHRAGPFRLAFDHRAQLVYGTGGSPEENAWAFAKARFDAETFYYRGNGAFDIVPDTAFDSVSEPDRSIILYGNAATNRAWAALLGDSPVQVRPGDVAAGDRTFSGDDLVCLLVRPRPGSDVSLVAAIAPAGLAGARAADRLPYFTSGVHYPDCTIFSAAVLRDGLPAVKAAGFFGNDWTIESGDFAWSE